MADWKIDPAEMEIVRFIHQHFPRYSTYQGVSLLNRLAQWRRIIYFPIKSRRPGACWEKVPTTAVLAIKQRERPDAAIARLRAEIERIDRELDNLMSYACQGAIAPTQLKEQNQRLLGEKQEKQLNKLTKSNAQKSNPSVFTEEFLANLPNLPKFLYEKKKLLFIRVVRLIFTSVVLNSERGGRHRKRGLTLLHGQRSLVPTSSNRSTSISD